MDKAPTEDFAIDKIIDHNINTSRKHRYSKAGEPIYGVRWYGFETDDDAWEQTRSLPRGKIFRYYQKKKLPITGSINQAKHG